MLKGNLLLECCLFRVFHAFMLCDGMYSKPLYWVTSEWIFQCHVTLVY